eukprot:CAMPEP_0205833422 /NCGR_PEP_ID=MMETSP0206-20130828/49660_1 /ASSEMBLY_ACC=CAM_ASM_000279 /TAXON_ID=36767 /ORGANISM="Euplotes focardii, Strain TN1" /LENGTH=532 /DNA_ID=CAMNT_0053139793 /DNA_START=12 /DNA_END=1608 /DNA_ORIENTATION=+
MTNPYARRAVPRARRKEEPDPTQPISLKDDRYKILRLLGTGTFGSVYLVQDVLIPGAPELAMKVLKFPKERNEHLKTQMAGVQRECDILKELSHKNIVLYLGSRLFQQETCHEVHIFMEFVPGNSLQHYLDMEKQFTPAHIRHYIKQILQGLEYLHNQGVVHRDIKPANLLRTIDGSVKIADFGGAKFTQGAGKSLEMTLNDICSAFFAPPEVVQQTYSSTFDIWSMAVSAIFMTGQHPWPHHSSNGAIAFVFHLAKEETMPRLPTNLPAEALAFVKACLNRDPKARPSASRLLAHPWLVADMPAVFEEKCQARAMGVSLESDEFKQLLREAQQALPPSDPVAVLRRATARQTVSSIRGHRRFSQDNTAALGELAAWEAEADDTEVVNLHRALLSRSAPGIAENSAEEDRERKIREALEREALASKPSKPMSDMSVQWATFFSTDDDPEPSTSSVSGTSSRLMSSGLTLPPCAWQHISEYAHLTTSSLWPSTMAAARHNFFPVREARQATGTCFQWASLPWASPNLCLVTDK